jgi:hypothetical protein
LIPTDSYGGPADNLYFAEGNTLPDFADYMVILNPGTSPANVRFTYMMEGQANKLENVRVAR